MIARGYRKYLVGAVVLISGAAVAGLVYWRQSNRPRISFDKTELVFRKCRVGKEYPFSVSIRNDGRRPLRLRIGAVTCACSEVRLEKKVLLPGESTSLTGELRPASASGSFSSSIAIASNDPNDPVTEVTLRGEVEPYLAVSPSVVSLRPNMREPCRAPLRVRNTDDKPVTFSVSVSGVSADPSASNVTLGPKEASVIDFSCPADVIQYQEGRIILNTDDDVLPSVAVPVSVVPARGLEVHPARIRFGFVSRSEVATKRYTLFVRGPLAESASIAELSMPGFLQVADRKEDATTGAKEITFSFSDECTSGALDGTVTLRVHLKDQPINETTITVPVGGIVQ